MSRLSVVVFLILVSECTFVTMVSSVNAHDSRFGCKQFAGYLFSARIRQSISLKLLTF